MSTVDFFRHIESILKCSSSKCDTYSQDDSDRFRLKLRAALTAFLVKSSYIRHFKFSSKTFKH